MKKQIFDLFTIIIKPLYGTGIGKYFPFKQLNYLFNKYAYVYFTKNGKFIKKTNYGFKMFIYPDDNCISQEIATFGAWEKDVSDIFIKYLKKGDCVLDIGANIGFFSLLSSILVGKKGKVLCFEPSTKNYNKLIENINLNGFKNLNTYKLGAGNTKGEFEIFYNPLNPGMTSLVENTVNEKFEKEVIKVIILDQFLKGQKIDLIKMDIEGFEKEGIDGMVEIIKKNLNIKLIFEWSPILYKNKVENYEAYSIEILENLKKIGFKLFTIGEKNIQIIDFKKYFYEINNSIGQSNILCVKI